MMRRSVNTESGSDSGVAQQKRRHRGSVYVKATALAVAIACGLSAWQLEAAEPPAPATTNDPAQAPATAGTQNTTAAAPAERVLLDPVTEQIAALAKEEHPPTQVLTLGEAPNQFLGLYVPRNTALVSGGLIIVPDDGTHPDWPGAVHALRSTLPDYGWDTLSVAIPPLPLPAIPERTLPVLKNMSEVQQGAATSQAPAENTTAPATPAADAPTTLPEQNPPDAANAAGASAAADTQRQDYVTLVNTRIQSAESYLTSQGVQKIVVLGVGSGAALAAQYLAGKNDSSTTLIMVDTRPVDAPISIDIMATLAGFNGPVLDLYHGDYRNRLAKMRRDNARRFGKLAYEQIRLQPRFANPAEDWAFLVQRVRGWLKTRQQERPVDPRTPG
ncbi:DUF3530 family protein [Pokkaliibacter sp. CJK22405]|uniref:DUF3530 family protein n=1 Tax=Pokkaliibacter sp. CJK22405 TaxID=3384615 RepID=UPI003984DC7B